MLILIIKKKKVSYADLEIDQNVLDKDCVINWSVGQRVQSLYGACLIIEPTFKIMSLRL